MGRLQSNYHNYINGWKLTMDRKQKSKNYIQKWVNLIYINYTLMRKNAEKVSDHN